MQFDPDNNVVKLCAQGMEKEFEGEMVEAAKLFLEAWNEATNDFEKFIAGHYVARHQSTVADKLKWDEIALGSALKISEEEIKGSYPSLYLNVGKCYEDLNDFDNAKKNYDLALSYSHFLPEDGYGKMIKSGINNGLERIASIS